MEAAQTMEEEENGGGTADQGRRPLRGNEKERDCARACVFESCSVFGDSPGQALETGTTIRIAPMARKCGGWNDEHFHDHLRIPLSSARGEGMVVTLEAMAKECVAVALSPQDSFVMGKTYAIHFGANGNLETVIRRRLNRGEAVDATFPSRVCGAGKFVAYWVVWCRGNISVGIGPTPFQHTIGTLKDDLYDQLRSGVDAVRFVGLGNSALSSRNSSSATQDVKVRNVVVSALPVGFEVPALPETTFVSWQDLETNNANGMMDDDDNNDASNPDQDAELVAEYQLECAKARARADKFGVPYKQAPSPHLFLKWSEARRLRANPQAGFVTGLDLASPEEVRKADARKRRFAQEAEEINNKARRKGGLEGDDHDEDEAMQQEDADKNHELGQGKDGNDDTFAWPVQDAWENEDLVSQFRVDPPVSLYPPPQQDEGAEQLEDGVHEDGKYWQKQNLEEDGDVRLVPEKIHIFSIDWPAFKQIRSDDVMAHFAAYGPSYVEWLGEVSCNVFFGDRFSAARALTRLSQALPSPPLQEGKPDFGKMGWRLAKRCIRKRHNDAHGRRGTQARVLMRLATSLDVLAERPPSLPTQKPPGFSTQRILGPRRPKQRLSTVRALCSAAPRAGFTVEQMEAERMGSTMTEATPGGEGMEDL